MKNKITPLKEIKNKEIIIIKRDGRKEPFYKRKLSRVCNWATDNNKTFIDILLRDTEIKLKGEIKVTDMYDSLINTAVSKVSQLQPQWQFVASKLYIMKLYSEAYGIKSKKYPHLREVIKKGIEYKVYNKDVMNSYSDEEIEEINNLVDPERDFSFTYNALKQFNSKYCKKYTKTKKLELPQLTYIRVAMGLAYNLTDLEYSRVKIIKKLYNILSYGYATLATPIMMNSGTPLNQFASCILNTIGNDTWDIMNKLSTAGLYTKGRGGLAFDVSYIQAKGSVTKNGVKASGIIPYIKDIESVVISMMQGDDRRGSAVITCNWWHLEIEDFLMLKDASSGTPENRALHLQYTMATNDLFMEAVQKNKDVYLFDPLSAKSLLYVSGKEFEKEYKKLLNKKGIPKKKISARELFKQFLKYRFQTGNLYQFFTENVNKTSMSNRHIGSSNLCTEILEPSRPGKLIKESIIKEDGEESMIIKFKDEEIALCNLASYNLNITDLPKDEMDEIVYIISLVLDNTIDIGKYMRIAGKKTNIDYRYVGQGTSNYANNLAMKNIKMDTFEAEEETFKMFQKLSLSIIKNNARLAKEKGRFPKFYETKWAEGIIPFDLGNKAIKKKFKHLIDEEEIEYVKSLIRKDGVRNALMMAIAPTASSATSRDLTEAIEPIMNYSYRLEGAVSGSVLVPNFQECNKSYSLAYEIDPSKLLILGAIRQLFIDQSQSMNMYIDEDKWDYEYLAELHILAWKLGIKTLYYLNTPKSGEQKHCDSCSS